MTYFALLSNSKAQVKHEAPTITTRLQRIVLPIDNPNPTRGLRPQNLQILHFINYINGARGPSQIRAVATHAIYDPIASNVWSKIEFLKQPRLKQSGN